MLFFFFLDSKTYYSDIYQQKFGTPMPGSTFHGLEEVSDESEQGDG